MNTERANKPPLGKGEIVARLFAFGVSAVIVVGYIVWFATFQG